MGREDWARCPNEGNGLVRVGRDRVGHTENLVIETRVATLTLTEREMGWPVP